MASASFSVLLLVGVSCWTSFVQSQTPLTLGSFWNNTAHFEFVSANRFPTLDNPANQYGMNVGFFIHPINETLWYLFHREYAFEPQPSYCQYDYARIVLRTSTDSGVTWSNETVLISPIPNSPQECAIVDGAAFFDVETTTWHYMGQCLTRTHTWNMCHYTRQGISPAGPFTPDPANPVVVGGQLWSQICALPGAHCKVGMVDEGTPEIIQKDAQGYFYVTFHGWDASIDQSARGVAKTLDFVHWVVDGEGLPGDAMFTSMDCDKWNISWAQNQCVGGGEGTMLQQDGVFYHLIEAPDLSLGCNTSPGAQNWVLGLLRAEELAATMQWDQDDNPTVVPVVKQGCYIQYHRLFADEASTYLEYWADEWMQIFRLVEGPGPHPIVAGAPPS